MQSAEYQIVPQFDAMDSQPIIPRILLVDDIETNLFLLEEILQEIKAEFVYALSGKQAVELAANQEFAIALVDVQMPLLDGYQTVEMMRLNQESKLLPVIFISAIYSDDYYKIKGIKSGAVDFISKPIEPDILIGKVQVFINLYVQKKKLEQYNIQLKQLVEQKEKIAQALRDHEEQLSTITNAAQDGIIMLNADAYIEFWNPAAEKIFEYHFHEISQSSIYQTIVSPDRVEEFKKIYNQIIDTGNADILVSLFEIVAMRKGKEYFPLEINISSVIIKNQRHIIAIVRDITERKKIEAHLKNSLDEKERLLSEIHHRVKNNMQMVSTILSLQANYGIYDNPVTVFEESIDRINSMAMVHEKLYLSKNFGEIEISNYIQELSYELVGAYQGDKNLQLELDVDSLMIEIDSAITLGLLLNELITNTIKHAFPNRNQGAVYINLKLIEGNYIHLNIGDNGVGLPVDFTVRKKNSLGMQLIEGFVKELNGKLITTSDKGANFDIVFKPIKKSRKKEKYN